MSTNIKKRKKRKWYHQGKLKITKCEKEIEYRSGWEKDVSLMFDFDSSIVSVEYESLRIPYITNIRTRKVKIYFPDFLIEFIDGTKKIIEIKRDDRVQTKIVKTKAAAAEKYIKANLVNTTYEIWNKKTIDEYKKKLGYKLPPPEKKKNTKQSKKSTSRKSKPKESRVKDPVAEKLFETYNKCTRVKTKIKK